MRRKMLMMCCLICFAMRPPIYYRLGNSLRPCALREYEWMICESKRWWRIYEKCIDYRTVKVAHPKRKNWIAKHLNRMSYFLNSTNLKFQLLLYRHFSVISPNIVLISKGSKHSLKLAIVEYSIYLMHFSISSSVHSSGFLKFYQRHWRHLLEVQEQHRWQSGRVYSTIGACQSRLLGCKCVHHRWPTLFNRRLFHTVYITKLQQTIDICNCIGETWPRSGTSICWTGAKR